MNPKRILIAGAVAVGGGIALASAAWACATIVPPAVVTIEEPSPAKALVGTQAMVHGKNFVPGPVALAWGVNANEARKVADVSADSKGNFTARIAVPDAAPGNYYVFGLGPAKEGLTYEPAPFEVLRPDAGPVDPGPPQSYVTSNSASANGLFSADATSPTGPASGPSASPGSVTNPIGVSLPGSGVLSAPAGTAGATAGAARSALAGLTGAGGDPSRATANGPQGLLAGQPALAESAAALAAQSPDNPALPSSRSFARDLWSGFTKGSGPTQVPSLLDAPASSGHTPGLALGMGLALGATIALCSGFGLAEARRRRALA